MSSGAADGGDINAADMLPLPTGCRGGQAELVGRPGGNSALSQVTYLVGGPPGHRVDVFELGPMSNADAGSTRTKWPGSIRCEAAIQGQAQGVEADRSESQKG